MNWRFQPPRVSLPHKAAKCKVTLTPEGQLESHTGGKKLKIKKKKTGRKETKIQKTSVKSANALAEFGSFTHQWGDSGKSGENSWGPAGNLNITFVYVPDHECWNKGFKCNFPGNKSPPGHCQVSPVLSSGAAAIPVCSWPPADLQEDVSSARHCKSLLSSGLIPKSGRFSRANWNFWVTTRTLAAHTPKMDVVLWLLVPARF